MKNLKQATEWLKQDLSVGTECIIEIICSEKTGITRAYYCGDATLFAAGGGGYDKVGTVLGSIVSQALQGLLSQHREANLAAWKVFPGNGRSQFKCVWFDGATYRINGASGRDSVAELLHLLGCRCIWQHSKLGYVYVIALPKQ